MFVNILKLIRMFCSKLHKNKEKSNSISVYPDVDDVIEGSFSEVGLELKLGKILSDKKFYTRSRCGKHLLTALPRRTSR